MRRPAGIVVRVVLVGCAVAAAVLLVRWQHDEDRCADVRATVSHARGTRLASAVRELRQHCSPDDARMAAMDLARGGNPAAASLARDAVRRQPDDFRTWATLSLALVRRDPAGAERARVRAIRLNPKLAPRRGR